MTTKKTDGKPTGASIPEVKLFVTKKTEPIFIWITSITTWFIGTDQEARENSKLYSRPHKKYYRVSFKDDMDAREHLAMKYNEERKDYDDVIGY